MGRELEIKLSAPDAAALEKVCTDAQAEAARRGGWQEIHMETAYLDTPEHAIAARRWMLRRRTENGAAVYTMKTPGDGYVRGEWESRKESLHEAVLEMIRAGAPEALEQLVQGGVERVCGVSFVRRTAELELADGTRCMLCADSGQLLGGCRKRPFCEVELELTAGPAEPMLAFAGELRERYALREERKSKFVRAAELDGQEG